MKFGKVMIIILGICVLAGCQNMSSPVGPENATPAPSPQATQQKTEPENQNGEEKVVYTEEMKTWITALKASFGEDKPGRVILGPDEINALNEEIKARSGAINDVSDSKLLDELTTDEIIALIEKGTAPINHFDKDMKPVSEETYASIEENRNISSKEAVQNFQRKLGVATSRADVRTVPYKDPLFKDTANTYYDRIQETELVVGTPVFVLSESKDGEFYFVRSYFYDGWVTKKDIAIAENEDAWNEFAKSEARGRDKFAVITDSLLKIEGVSLDMGVKLPKAGEDEANYKLILPVRKSDGNLDTKEISVKKTSANDGFLTYTFENYYVQAMKYLGTMYGWGGMNDGVDCSSYACAVFRTFGVYLPRNSGPQGKAAGNVTALEGVSNDERLEMFKNLDVPAIIWRPGHIMLWLGVKDGKCYIINAPSGGREVCISELDITTEKINICRIN